MNISALIDKLAETHSLSRMEYEYLVAERTELSARTLADRADRVRKKIYGNTVYIRGLIEISNFCKNDCFYCGIRKGNKHCERYRLTEADIIGCAETGYALGFRTFVLQGGEDGFFTDDFLCRLIRTLKQRFSDCAITLSLGERSFKSYKRLYEAGADRYLLRHETADKTHYGRLHPAQLSYDNRMRCLHDLRTIGFQTGCGFMVGSPYQTAAVIAQDLKFIETFKPEMCGIGPFIPHRDTPFKEQPAGTSDLTCYLLSIIRLIHPVILLPATTALDTIDPKGRIRGIAAGANVVMPNLSPPNVRNKYELYNNKAHSGAEAAENKKILDEQLFSAGYQTVISRGDVYNPSAYNTKSTRRSNPTQREEYMTHYNPASSHAENFICDEEILETIAYAEAHKTDSALIDQILEKARPKRTGSRCTCQGLTHREASVLLACEIPEKISRIYEIANEIKLAYYGNRVVIFAPLYLSNYCVNGCVYCPYHRSNTRIPRKKLSQEEIKAEVIALQDMGHKRLAVEAGEDPVHNPIEYILESIKTIYSIKHKNGAIRRVNVNIAATTTENYRKLHEAEIGTYILFQETYHKETYQKLHPSGPKHNYDYHTEAPDRAMDGGIDDVGIGVLFGLERYKYEFTGLLMHAEHLEAVYGVGPHTISVPRIKQADGVNPADFDNGIDDDTFAKITACIRLAVPYTGLIISTRENEAVRKKLLTLGVSQISGGSRTTVGGYTTAERPHDTEQFDVSDQRTLDDVVRWLMNSNYIPSFCTACYREGRTGDRFMSLCKSGQILNCCHPNALMTLAEYIEDYASADTRRIGYELIEQELARIPRENIRTIARQNIEAIKHHNRRDFHF